MRREWTITIIDCIEWGIMWTPPVDFGHIKLGCVLVDMHISVYVYRCDCVRYCSNNWCNFSLFMILWKSLQPMMYTHSYLPCVFYNQNNGMQTKTTGIFYNNFMQKWMAKTMRNLSSMEQLIRFLDKANQIKCHFVVNTTKAFYATTLNYCLICFCGFFVVFSSCKHSIVWKIWTYHCTTFKIMFWMRLQK